MKVLRHLDSLRQETSPVVLAAGFFDGVHLGHQRILEASCGLAAQCGAECWVLTFDIHPRSVVSNSPPPLLTCNKHKLLLMRRFGVQGCLLLPFTKGFATTPADRFVCELRNSAPTLAHIVVGTDWRFGQGAQGDVKRLRQMCGACGIAVSAIPPVLHGERVVSSTRIRAAIIEGRLDDAEAELGRPFSILGNVTHGKALGRKLGIPTANLACDNEALPPTGVYAVYAAMEGAIHEGVLNFGTRPTVGGDPKIPVVELHILDANRDLYGQDIEVFFIQRLRAEARFKSVALMCAAITRDIENARAVLSKKNIKDRLYTHCFSVI